MRKRILITGTGSFLGTAVEKWLKRFNGQYIVDRMSMRTNEWKKTDFSVYDSIYHVVGIAHADINNVSEEVKREYYTINCDMAVELAILARAAGVKQFIYMSSLLVYGDSGTGKINEANRITKDTMPHPSNFYGDSKWQAEKKLRELEAETFHIAILRPPMIYGDGCKGNYNALVKIARYTPFFPDYPNKRSVLFISNLAEFVKQLIDSGKGGVFLPQNKEHIKTADFISEIGKAHGRRIKITKALNWMVRLGSHFPGSIGRLVNKAFGSEWVDLNISGYFDGEYQIYNFEKSIKETENT